MSKLAKALESIKSSNKKKPALMSHVVLGFPDLELSKDIVRAMAESGASIIELQIPFSDPMADGPSIMRASEKALENGVTPEDCFKAMDELSSELEVPLLFMSYYNIVFANGIQSFVASAKEAGCEGLIIPDVPPEESNDGFFDICRENQMPSIPLVSPLTSNERIETIKSKFSNDSFVYCVSTTGTTGAREELPEGLEAYLNRVTENFPVPKAVGFGISKSAHLEQLSGLAEIAVCGSAIVNKAKDADQEGKDPASEVGRFVSELLS